METFRYLSGVTTLQLETEACVGCGMCENVCPQGATSIKITDSSFVNDLIKKLEDHVDVTSQT